MKALRANYKTMYIVTETFIAKPGYAGKLAAMMKEEMSKDKSFRGKVMIDFVTNYNKILIQYELESLAEFDKAMAGQQKIKAKQKKNAKPPEYTQYYLTGKREIYRVL